MFTTLWIIWGILFAVIEAVALFNDKQGDTLSEHFRKWFSTHTNIGRTIWLVISALFFLWFGIHIGWEGTI